MLQLSNLKREYSEVKNNNNAVAAALTNKRCETRPRGHNEGDPDVVEGAVARCNNQLLLLLL